MNRADFQQTGGFPLETDTLDFMQESYTQLQHLATSIAGDTPSIISGCNVVGSTVSNGWVVINGELLPFEGGALGTKVGIVETVDSKPFEDGTKDVYRRRKAVFNLSGIINWVDLKRVQPLLESNSVYQKSISNLSKTFSIGDRTILHGVEVTKDGNNYTHTGGAIYYNGNVYTVEPLSVPLLDTGTPRWKISVNSKFENKMYLTSSFDSDGVIDYLSIPYYNKEVWVQNAGVSEVITSMETVQGCTCKIFEGGVGPHGVRFVKVGKQVYVSGACEIYIPNSTAANRFMSGSGYHIGFVKLNLEASYKGTGIWLGGGFTNSHGVATCYRTQEPGRTWDGVTFAFPSIDRDGNIIINQIPGPGLITYKHITIQFNLMYFLLNE
jgi:hypothetical protein